MKDCPLNGGGLKRSSHCTCRCDVIASLRVGVLQVDFLNSVIIDLQKKNDELQQRLDIMETGGQLMNGASDSLELR